MKKNQQVNKFFVSAFLVIALSLANMVSHAEPVALDPELKPYEPVSGISGSINSIGSDTMNNLMALWAEGFRKFYPNVTPEIEGKGSSTAPPALISGAANFAPMSRLMKDAEIDEFKKKFGYEPTLLQTGIDVIAIYVHKDNPLESLTLKQVDAIFSQNRLGGYSDNISTWGGVGLEGEWANMPISLYGRNAASGTYGYFKTNALFGGDFKSSVKEQPGSSAVIQGIATDKAGIGYSGIGYMTADVRAVALGIEGVGAFEPNGENGYTGDYPLSRFLYVYVNYQPGSELDPLRREFIKYIFSRNGQEDVMKQGYYPINAGIARRNLERFGIE